MFFFRLRRAPATRSTRDPPKTHFSKNIRWRRAPFLRPLTLIRNCGVYRVYIYIYIYAAPPTGSYISMLIVLPLYSSPSTLRLRLPRK